MLKCETNSPAMAARVLAAFKRWTRRQYETGQDHRYKTPTVDFEHGQWWVTDTETGAQWSVCDAEGGPAVDGFDFEKVTEGEEP